MHNDKLNTIIPRTNQDIVLQFRFFRLIYYNSCFRSDSYFLLLYSEINKDENLNRILKKLLYLSPSRLTIRFQNLNGSTMIIRKDLVISIHIYGTRRTKRAIKSQSAYMWLQIYQGTKTITQIKSYLLWRRSTVRTRSRRSMDLFIVSIQLVINYKVTNMSKSLDPAQIKQQLSKFINLLQTDNHQNQQAYHLESRMIKEYGLQKKLSTIFSASEPQCSSLDKENFNPSANRSFQTGEKDSKFEEWPVLIGALLSMNLSLAQTKVVEKLKIFYSELMQDHQRLILQNSSLKSALFSEKKVNNQMLNVLFRLDEQEKQLSKNFNRLENDYHEEQQKKKAILIQFQKLTEDIQLVQKDNDFMKKLIFHANQSYEALEKKYNSLQKDIQKGSVLGDRKDCNKSSMDNLLKSAKTKKNSYSPNHSEQARASSPQNFQGIYQKLIIRTLKSKGRKQ